mmetsp:Transcript_26733/g.69297  ORF Transcript_26733/g.69297 Transcript_26733/m.69297 type:complete len:622 (-) Transcript_26733:313-2178(-)
MRDARQATGWGQVRATFRLCGAPHSPVPPWAVFQGAHFNIRRTLCDRTVTAQPPMPMARHAMTAHKGTSTRCKGRAIPARRRMSALQAGPAPVVVERQRLGAGAPAAEVCHLLPVPVAAQQLLCQLARVSGGVQRGRVHLQPHLHQLLHRLLAGQVSADLPLARALPLRRLCGLLDRRRLRLPRLGLPVGHRARLAPGEGVVVGDRGPAALRDAQFLQLLEVSLRVAHVEVCQVGALLLHQQLLLPLRRLLLEILKLLADLHLLALVLHRDGVGQQVGEAGALRHKVDVHLAALLLLLHDLAHVLRGVRVLVAALQLLLAPRHAGLCRDQVEVHVRLLAHLLLRVLAPHFELVRRDCPVGDQPHLKLLAAGASHAVDPLAGLHAAIGDGVYGRGAVGAQPLLHRLDPGHHVHRFLRLGVLAHRNPHKEVLDDISEEGVVDPLLQQVTLDLDGADVLIRCLLLLLLVLVLVRRQPAPAVVLQVGAAVVIRVHLRQLLVLVAQGGLPLLLLLGARLAGAGALRAALARLLQRLQRTVLGAVLVDAARAVAGAHVHGVDLLVGERLPAGLRGRLGAAAGRLAALLRARGRLLRLDGIAPALLQVVALRGALHQDHLAVQLRHLG